MIKNKQKKRKSNLPFFAVWAYYTPSTAAAMDLHNNEIGIQIAEKYKNEIVWRTELNKMIKPYETMDMLIRQFPNCTDRQIFFIKKAQQEMEKGNASYMINVDKNEDGDIVGK